MAQRQKLDFDRFYRRMTIGQLWLFDNDLLEFVKLTNPFGSGDDNVQSDRGTPLKPRVVDIEPTANVAHNLATQIKQGWGENASRMRDLGKIDIANLPVKDATKLRVLLGDLEKGRDASNRR